MYLLVYCFFFNDTATTGIYTYGHTLSLPDALPIYAHTSDEEAAAIAKLKGQVAAIRAGGEIAGADTPLRQPVAYWRSTEAVDPVAEAKSVGLPMLVLQGAQRSEEHTSELQSLMRISYAVFCLKKKNRTKHTN